MIKAYKYRVYPNKEQQKLIQKTFGCARYVYNTILFYKKEVYVKEKRILSKIDCNNYCNRVLKKEYEWLKEVDKFALTNAIYDMESAYQKFFKEHSGYPKFKSKKNRYKSYRTNFSNPSVGGNIKFLSNHIQIPKVGKVKYRGKLIPQGRILNATISQEPNGHYYISLCCTDVEVQQFSKTEKNIGIDLGIADFAILSDGTKIENLRFYEKSEKKLAKLQRELSRKTIGGSNWNKARIKVANLQKHISNQRKDFLQKLTTQLVKDYDIICIEDLDVSELKETDNTTRNKHVSDVSWSEFRRMLTYKCEWYGKKLSVVDRYYPSSQICHVCGNRDGKKTLDIRSWKCKCGAVLDRDINAAVNILNEGLRLAV